MNVVQKAKQEKIPWCRLLCTIACGAAVLLAAFLIGYRSTLANGLWFPMSTNSDEVVYNRQLAAVLAKGGPQGYFGYNESHAAIGGYSTWGPFVIWLYAIPGVLFGTGYNTVFWCNMVFGLLCWCVFTWHMDWKHQLAFVLGLFCAWLPLRQIFTGTSEPLHFFLLAVILASSRAVEDGKRGSTAVALLACVVETIIRPYGVVMFLFPIVYGWKKNCGRLRLAGTVAAALMSVVFSLWAMNTLAAPYSEQSLDFTVFTKMGQGDVPGAVAYFFQKLFAACVSLWADYLQPTLHGSAEQYIVDAAHGFLRVLLFMATILALCLYDTVKKRAIRGKVCGLICAATIFLAILVLYNPLQLRRYSAFLCLLLLMAAAAEDLLVAVLSVPLLVLLVFPAGFAHTDGLPAYNAGMNQQMIQVTEALQQSQDRLMDEKDPWQHTLSFAYGDVHYGYLYALPAGMGIEFDWNTYLADPENTINARYVMVNHDTEAEARLLEEGWQVLVSTENEIVYERPL